MNHGHAVTADQLDGERVATVQRRAGAFVEDCRRRGNVLGRQRRRRSRSIPRSYRPALDRRMTGRQESPPRGTGTFATYQEPGAALLETPPRLRPPPPVAPQTPARRDGRGHHSRRSHLHWPTTAEKLATRCPIRYRHLSARI